MPCGEPGLGPSFHHPAERRSRFGGEGIWFPSEDRERTRSWAPTFSMANDVGVNACAGSVQSFHAAGTVGLGEGREGDGEGEGVIDGVGVRVSVGAGVGEGSAVGVRVVHHRIPPRQRPSTIATMAATRIFERCTMR